MKKKDIIFIGCVVICLLPFFVSEDVYSFYKTFNAEHGMIMSFLKFAILSTLGECIGLRISAGVYNRKGFGILPRAFVWGILGMGISMAMTIFANGVPAFLTTMGMTDAMSVMGASLSWPKVFVAFCISVAMNTIFAPVFMTLHKITDTHIINNGGTLRGFFTPIPMGEIMANLNWRVQWNFVFKKTIPFFWYPAHTITFLLPGDMRVLFAALLGVALGVLLAIATHKK
ncbi:MULTISPECIES: hypothetical protein [Porphyromonadaceae]|uniref:Membrane protein n=1 Tax=Sanguibacteroides justesenii TaxID=1547597 RepID=A0A0C3MD84_9PORP|nr:MULTISPECIES: hypothetical protein [Porphyromonadaceae]KIO44348.1 membrane protein [Sanguibacteroides justesenii]KIO45395.1 membrane protein [Sanguibacteroides justesenii]PXZ44680.1 hypothetical protein DMB45_04380 [Sanguibacteroides justesenii]